MREGLLVSDEAKKVWESLNPEERAAIDKYNPFKKDRNAAIRALWARGVRQIIIAELTGLTPVSISLICNEEWKEKKRAEG